MIKLITSARRNDSSSILEMTISPKTGNPNHYHTRFDETFEVLSGALQVAHKGIIITLKKGKKYTIPKGEVHSFKNVADNDCMLRITLEPSNLDFENAMLIYYGLKRDGQIHTNGNPKKINDLAVFIYLNNTNMKGIGKIVEITLKSIARRAIKKGHLTQLLNKYAQF